MALKLQGLASVLARTLTIGRYGSPRIARPLPNIALAAKHEAFPQISALPTCFSQSQRFWHSKKVIKIPPTNIPNFDYSGDKVYTLPVVDINSPKYGFTEVEELKSADKTVQEIFSVKFASRATVFKQQLQDTLEKIQEHPADLQSLEVKIAYDTVRLRNQVYHMGLYRKDKICKVKLIERIQRRNKNLRKLRNRDGEKFEWLLEELKIRYIPLKPMYQAKKRSRRVTRKNIARQAYWDTMNQKLDNLKIKLQDERKAFEIEREQELGRIQEQLKDLGIENMDSVESVVKELGMEKHLEKKELRMKRRYVILAKKFELWEKNLKKQQQEEQS